MGVYGCPESFCFTWRYGIKGDRKANRNETRVDRRAGYRRAFQHIDAIRSDKGSFYFPRLTFLLYPVTSSREFPERLPRGIPENEFRVAQRRCIDLDDRYSPAARKAARGRMKRGTRERDFNFYLRPIKIVYSSSALVPRENCLLQIIYASDVQRIPKLLSRAAVSSSTLPMNSPKQIRKILSSITRQ